MIDIPKQEFHTICTHNLVIPRVNLNPICVHCLSGVPWEIGMTQSKILDVPHTFNSISCENKDLQDEVNVCLDLFRNGKGEIK